MDEVGEFSGQHFASVDIAKLEVLLAGMVRFDDFLLSPLVFLLADNLSKYPSFSDRYLVGGIETNASYLHVVKCLST